MTNKRRKTSGYPSSNMGEKVDKMALYQTSGGYPNQGGWHLKFQGGLTLSGGGVNFLGGDQTPNYNLTFYLTVT